MIEIRNVMLSSRQVVAKSGEVLPLEATVRYHWIGYMLDFGISPEKFAALHNGGDLDGQVLLEMAHEHCMETPAGQLYRCVARDGSVDSEYLSDKDKARLQRMKLHGLLESDNGVYTLPKEAQKEVSSEQ